MTFGLSGGLTVGAFGYKKAAFPGQDTVSQSE